jgi:hypothetical protein
MTLIDLDALRRAELQRDPFDYLVVPDFLAVGALDRVNADYPPIETAANHPLDRLDSGPAFAALMDELQGAAFREVLGQQFNLDLSDMPSTVTVRKFCERTDGNIHTDHRSKVLTVLVYFNESWPHAAGQLRLLRCGDDIDDYAAEVAPLGGTLLAFRRTDHSWHGHTRYVGERRMVQVNFLDQSPVAVAAQRLSRFGTHFMKNVLGMR